MRSTWLEGGSCHLRYSTPGAFASDGRKLLSIACNHQVWWPAHEKTENEMDTSSPWLIFIPLTTRQKRRL